MAEREWIYECNRCDKGGAVTAQNADTFADLLEIVERHHDTISPRCPSNANARRFSIRSGAVPSPTTPNDP